MCQLEDAVIEVLCERAGPDADPVAMRAAATAVLATFGTAMRTWIEQGAEGELDPILDRCVSAARAAFAG